MGDYENYTESELLDGSPVHSTRNPHDATEGERIPVELTPAGERQCRFTPC